MKDFLRKQRTALFVLLLAGICAACSDDGEPGAGEMNITQVALPEEVSAQAGDPVTIGGSGFKSGDELRLRSVLTGTTEHTARLTQVTDSSLTFEIPDDLSSGEYKVYLYRGTTFRLLGRIRFDIVSPIPDRAGMNIKGIVSCQGEPVAGVVVSDGLQVATTDAKGIYYLQSDKRNGYVFISVPGGYEVAADRTRPQFYKYLDQPAGSVEQRDFTLVRRANDRHRLVVFSDTHLANRVSDLQQFNMGFHSEMVSYLRACKAHGMPVYGIALGDLGWDQFWYDNNFDLSNYLDYIGDLSMSVFSVPGNHDNDRKVLNDDFGASAPYRRVLGPTDYSFNLGEVHYIMLDNTVYLNPTGDGSGFESRVTDEAMSWLKADLATVDRNTPVVVGMHIPLFKTPERGKSPAINLLNGAELIELLEAYDVQLLTGHAHTNFNLIYSDRLREHNIAAVSATWWWTGHTNHAGNHICRDGSPGGYKIFDVDARRITWRYKGIGLADDYQFRAYDLNRCLITKSENCPNANVSASVFTKYAGSYDQVNDKNEVLINVFDWAEDWRIEVTDLGDGKTLEPVPVRVRDPLHIISYNMTRLNRGGSTAVTFQTNWTEHAFRVTSASAVSSLKVVVTDSFGNTYAQQVDRPKKLSYMMR